MGKKLALTDDVKKLVDKLQEKGVLTREEAEHLKKEME